MSIDSETMAEIKALGESLRAQLEMANKTIYQLVLERRVSNATTIADHFVNEATPTELRGKIKALELDLASERNANALLRKSGRGIVQIAEAARDENRQLRERIAALEVGQYRAPDGAARPELREESSATPEHVEALEVIAEAEHDEIRRLKVRIAELELRQIGALEDDEK